MWINNIQILQIIGQNEGQIIRSSSHPRRLTLVEDPLQKNGAIPAFSKPLGQPQKALGEGQNSYPGVFFPGASNRRAMNVGIGSPDLYRRFSKALGKAYGLYQRF